MVKAAVLVAPQQGMVLMAALLVMVMLLLIGVSSARMALQGERAARGLRDRDIAMQAAEDALADAERELEGGGPDSARNVLVTGDGYVEGCGNGATAPDLGLCAAGAGDTPAWQQADIADDGAGARSVPFGYYTGAEMETGEGFLPFRKPRYVIERLPLPADAAAGTDHVYRVTAIGFGARASTEVVVQGTYRPAPGAAAGGAGGAGVPSTGGPTAKGARIAWREIANYRELRRAVKP